MFIFVVQLHAQGPKNLSGTMSATLCNDLARDSASVHISEQIYMVTFPAFLTCFYHKSHHSQMFNTSRTVISEKPSISLVTRKVHELHQAKILKIPLDHCDRRIPIPNQIGILLEFTFFSANSLLIRLLTYLGLREHIIANFEAGPKSA